MSEADSWKLWNEIPDTCTPLSKINGVNGSLLIDPVNDDSGIPKNLYIINAQMSYLV